MSVIVAHPGVQHSYQAALALQEARLLNQYATGFYFKNTNVFRASLRLLPGKIAKRLESELMRRRMEEIDDELVRLHPLRELMCITTGRLKCVGNRLGDLIPWRNRDFDAWMARGIAAKPPRAVICYDTAALETFKACRQNGVVGVLDQSIGHLAVGMRILREEALLHPEFADSIAADTPDHWVDRCRQEALLADWVLAGSDYAKQTLIETGVDPSRIVVLPYGADSDRFHAERGPGDGVFRVLFLGKISQRKGVKYLLEVFRRLRLPSAELLLAGGIIGSGKGLIPYEGVFKHLAHVPHHRVHTIFRAADIFVYPSLHEGSALGTYEAMASGLPVITTPNTGSIVRNGEEGFIVPVRDVEALMEKILLLYEDKDLRAEMGRKARGAAEHSTWQVYRQNLAQFFREKLQEA